jgi:ankyrin repeat protein
MQELLNDYMSDSIDSQRVIEKLQELESDPSVELDFNAFYDGWAPIHYAASKRDVTLFKFLVSRKADVSLRTEDTLGNVLHLALESDNCSLEFLTTMWSCI